MIKGTNTHPEDCYLWRYHPARFSRKPPRGRGWRRCGTAPWTPHLWLGFWSACGNTSTVDRRGRDGSSKINTSIESSNIAHVQLVSKILPRCLLSEAGRARLWCRYWCCCLLEHCCRNNNSDVLFKFKTWIHLSIIFALDSHTNYTETGIRVSILYSWRIDWLHCLVDLQERTAACEGKDTRKVKYFAEKIVF